MKTAARDKAGMAAMDAANRVKSGTVPDRSVIAVNLGGKLPGTFLVGTGHHDILFREVVRSVIL
jgi:hypothetical protein